MLCKVNQNDCCFIEITKSKEEYWNCPEHGRQGKAGFWLAKDRVTGCEFIVTDQPLESTPKSPSGEDK